MATQLLRLAPGHAEGCGIRDRSVEVEFRRILKDAEAIKRKLAKDVEALPE